MFILNHIGKRFPLSGNPHAIPKVATPTTATPALPSVPNTPELEAVPEPKLIIPGVMDANTFLQTFPKLPADLIKRINKLDPKTRFRVAILDKNQLGEYFAKGILNRNGTITLDTVSIRLTPEVLEGALEGKLEDLKVVEHEVIHALTMEHKLPRSRADVVRAIVTAEFLAHNQEVTDHVLNLLETVSSGDKNAIAELVHASNNIVHPEHLEKGLALYEKQKDAQAGDTVLIMAANIFGAADQDHDYCAAKLYARGIGVTFPDFINDFDIHDRPDKFWKIHSALHRALKQVTVTVKALETMQKELEPYRNGENQLSCDFNELLKSIASRLIKLKIIKKEERVDFLGKFQYVGKSNPRFDDSVEYRASNLSFALDGTTEEGIPTIENIASVYDVCSALHRAIDNLNRQVGRDDIPSWRLFGFIPTFFFTSTRIEGAEVLENWIEKPGGGMSRDRATPTEESTNIDLKKFDI